MSYRGHIKNGVAILDEPAHLADGTPVRVEVDFAESDFWKGKSIDELAREQGITGPQNLADLKMDWPTEDSIDDFLALIREVRK
jgi:hypothetical protein